MEELPKKSRRSRARSVANPKIFRLSDEDIDRLAALSDEWGCSEVAVIRRLLREATARNPTPPQDKPQHSLHTPLLPQFA